jgi:uncharacterized protein (DUF934 family)
MTTAPAPHLLPLPGRPGITLRAFLPAAHAELDTAGWPDAAAWASADPVAPGAALRLANDAQDGLLDALAPRLADVRVIALDFPKWVDGRAYSLARLLRRRYRYAGELRATGHVLVDMLPLLARCGFDAVVLQPGQSLAAARRALGFFEGHYQGDVVEPRPLYRRVAATAGDAA